MEQTPANFDSPRTPAFPSPVFDAEPEVAASRLCAQEQTAGAPYLPSPVFDEQVESGFKGAPHTTRSAKKRTRKPRWSRRSSKNNLKKVCPSPTSSTTHPENAQKSSSLEEEFPMEEKPTGSSYDRFSPENGLRTTGNGAGSSQWRGSRRRRECGVSRTFVSKRGDHQPIQIARLLLQSSDASAVIGKQGVNIALIRKESQANLEISPKHRASMFPHMQVAEIRGSAACMNTALYLIVAKINEVNSHRKNRESQEHAGVGGIDNSALEKNLPKHVTMSLLVPDSYIKYLYDDTPDNLLSIQRSSHADISVKVAIGESTEVPVVIQGLPEEVVSALSKIVEVTNSFQKPERLVRFDPSASGAGKRVDEPPQRQQTTIIEVSPRAAGSIIGVNGSNIDTLRKKCNASITVDTGNESSLRIVTIKGSRQSVQQAEKLINHILDVKEDTPYRRGSSSS